MSRQNGLNTLRVAGHRQPQLIRRYLAGTKQRSVVGSCACGNPPAFFYAESARMSRTRLAESSDRALVVAPMKREG